MARVRGSVNAGKNLSNDKSLEVNVVISQKKFELQNFWQQKWQETEWTKILRTDSVHKDIIKSTDL